LSPNQIIENTWPGFLTGSRVRVNRLIKITHSKVEYARSLGMHSEALELTESRKTRQIRIVMPKGRVRRALSGKAWGLHRNNPSLSYFSAGCYVPVSTAECESLPVVSRLGRLCIDGLDRGFSLRPGSKSTPVS
jgi:hypothetical protein